MGYALCYEANLIQAADLDLRVLSFNILKNNSADTGWSITQTEKVDRIVEVVNTTGADIIGFQEGQNHVSSVFNQLGGASAGWHLQLQSNPGGVWGTRYIMSKYPINTLSNNGLGAQFQLDANTTAWLFNIHLPYNAYGPYYVRDNPGASTQDYLDSTQLTYNTMQYVLNDIAASTSLAETVFLTGDFNDPSHLDWTQDAADAGLHFGEAVPWVTSTMTLDAGFKDSYRETYPDEVNHLGETWSPVYTTDVQDRIDFVYYRGDMVTLTDSQVIGEVGAPALGNVDVPIVNFPSDHRAVISHFTIASVLLGDLDGDEDIDGDDWLQYVAGLGGDLSGLTPEQRRAQGDLNGDEVNDFDDFVLFKDSYNSANGPGSFVAMLESSSAVPEPTTVMLVMTAGLLLWPVRRRAIR